MRQVCHLPIGSLRGQLQKMRAYTSVHEQMMACFICTDSSGDSVTVRLYESERDDGSDLMPNLSMRILMLPCPGKSMMHARHVQLLRAMLRRYGRVAVELRPYTQILSS